jgi:hypothetical protein
METKQLKKYYICDSTWHVANQFDTYTALKDDVDIDFILSSWRDWHRPEFQDMRPIPENIKFVPYYEEGRYDVAILHIDHSCLNKTTGKSQLYQQLNKNITDIPKIVINHSTPCDPMVGTQEEIVKGIKGMIGSNTMVVNSYESATDKEWGFGYPIVHGMDPKLYYDLEKEPRLFTALSVGGWSEYYNRDVMNRVIQILDNEYGYQLNWAKVNCLRQRNNFDLYRDFLGRSLIYFDPSIRTPMNRGRTEAFLSGCCVVQVEGAHDLKRWAKHGENIILVPNDPRKIAKVLVELLENNYDECIKIGQNGKVMAIKEFSPERFKNDWLKLLKQVTNK